MRKIALLALTALPLFAGFFPQTIETSISAVHGKSITLTTPLLQGMSGVVVHDYGNEIEAITSRLIQENYNDAKLISGDIIKHEKLPTISTEVSAGDKVI
jgi:hypothetical protein